MGFLKKWKAIVEKFRSTFFLNDNFTLLGYEFSTFALSTVFWVLMSYCMKMHSIFHFLMYVLFFLLSALFNRILGSYVLLHENAFDFSFFNVSSFIYFIFDKIFNSLLCSLCVNLLELTSYFTVFII